MAEPVLHHPRLAWDGARICVRVIESGHLCAWLDERLGLLLGPDFHRALFDSWDRLWWSERPDAPYVEAGLWRVRLEDCLRTRPDLAAPLHALIQEATARLGT